MDVIFGLCQCGCGEQTGIAKSTWARYGHVRGMPFKYKHGHYRSRDGRVVTSEGYVMVTAHGHPRAHQRGYVFEHILITEKALGHPLPNGAVIHHANRKRDDNRPGNLVVCEDVAYHCLIEVRTRALHACGNANWRKCTICRSWDDPSNMYVYRGRSQHGTARHRTCHTRAQTRRNSARGGVTA